MSWLTSVAQSVSSKISSHPYWTQGSALIGAGFAANGLASTSNDVVLGSLGSNTNRTASPPASSAAVPESKTAKLQLDERRYYNTVESLSQYNSHTSGTQVHSDRWLARVLPDHMIDGVASGVAKAFGQEPAPSPVAEQNRASLAYQYRTQEWEGLAQSLTHAAQGVAMVLAPSVLGWGATRAAQLLKAGSLEAFASHRITQGFGQVAAAALIAHSDPTALALPHSSVRKKRMGTKEVVTEPVKTSTKVVHDWEFGNNTTGHNYREGWLKSALDEVKNPSPFAEVTVPIALEIAEKVTRAEAFEAVKNRKPGQPLVVAPFPELDLLKAFAKKHLGQ